MAQVDTLIDTLEETAAKLAGATHGSAGDTVQLLCEFDSSLAQLRAECRELSMMNQLLRNRLTESIAVMRETVQATMRAAAALAMQPLNPTEIVLDESCALTNDDDRR